MTKQKVRIFGVPMDLGQQRRGVDMGPSAIRYAGLQERLIKLGYEVHDGGNIYAPQLEEITDDAVFPELDGKPAHHLPQISHICQEVYDRIQATLKTGEKAIFLGGDHSMSIGTVAAMATPKTGILWIDAHADINTPSTSPSGNIHGMVISALLGETASPLTDICYAGAKIKPAQIAYIGLRDVDEGERQRLSKGDIKAYTMREVDEHGMAHIAYQVLKHFADMTTIHVSLDLDGLDPRHAPGVGTPVPGGLTYREAHLLMEILADSHKVTSLDVVEVNPILDISNQTALTAVELVAGLMGQRIL
jgi:arginase